MQFSQSEVGFLLRYIALVAAHERLQHGLTHSNHIIGHDRSTQSLLVRRFAPVVALISSSQLSLFCKQAEHAAQIDKALRGIVLYNLAKLTVLEHILRSKHRITVEQQVIFRAAHGRFYLIHIVSSEMERD